MNKEQHRIYDNTPERKKARCLRDSLRRKNDPAYKLSENIRCSFRNFKRNKNLNVTWKDMGYSLKELKEHIESQFEDWMTWENQGKDWHIDHVIPMSWFSIDSWKECFALNNLQPMRASENQSKSNRYSGKFKENN